MQNLAFLDIETSINNDITVTGVYRPLLGTRQFIGKENTAENILSALEGVNIIFTYNGSRFDLPLINKRTELDLAGIFKHRDLMYDCWKNNLRGGLKKVELQLGIFRDTEGLTGYDAVILWESYLKGNAESLETLLRYNREDVENLEILAKILKII